MPDGLVQGHALLVRTPGPSSFLRKRRPLPVDSEAQNLSLLNPKSSPLQTLGISLCQPSSHPRRPRLLSLGDSAQPPPDTTAPDLQPPPSHTESSHVPPEPQTSPPLTCCSFLAYTLPTILFLLSQAKLTAPSDQIPPGYQ